MACIEICDTWFLVKTGEISTGVLCQFKILFLDKSKQMNQKWWKNLCLLWNIIELYAELLLLRESIAYWSRLSIQTVLSNSIASYVFLVFFSILNLFL